MDSWVAVSREVIGNNLLAVGFLNNKNKRIRVPVEELELFCNKNKVLNIIFNKASNNIASNIINIDSLDTYRYTPSGRCTYLPGIGEESILRLSNINNDENNIEDSVKNIDDKVDKIKEKAKVAVTVGLVAIATAGVKTLSKNISNISTKDIKQTIYSKLKRYEYILDKLIEAKYKTNKKIYNNKGIIEYSREIECESIKNSSIVHDLKTLGIPNYIRNIQTLIRICMEPIIKYDLMDTSLKDLGAETTFRVYSTALNNKIFKIKSLHLETKQLIQENRQTRKICAYDESQRNLIDSIDTEIAELESNIRCRKNINKSVIMKLKAKVSNIADKDTRNEYYDYLYSIESISIPEENSLIQKDIILKQLDDVVVLIDDMSMITCGKKETDGINQFIEEEIQSIYNMTTELNQHEKDEVMQRIEDVKTKLENKQGEKND